jgi:hypothetical protein
MTQLTLLTKAYRSSQLRQIDGLLKANFEGLDVNMELAVVADRWVQVSLSGEDETIATNFIRKEIGLCPVALDNVAKYATLKGYVKELGKNPDMVRIDVGIVQPEAIPATVPLSHLQAALVDGRKFALKKISELFGFCNNLPLLVKVTLVDRVKKSVDAELATAQLESFASWRESLLDRLIVLGAPLHEVKKTLDYAGLNRDIVNIESLGLFEHALTCKLGTDAAGLIRQIGGDLRDARFVVFNPRKIRSF